MKKNVYLKIIFSYFVWSFFGPIYNKSSFTAFQNTFLMSLFAVIVILMIYIFQKKLYLLKKIKISFNLVIFCIVSGLAGVIWLKSLTMVPVAMALFLFSSIPIVALILEIIVFKQKSKLLHVLAIIFGIIGTLVLLSSGFSSNGMIFNIGGVLVLVAVFLFAIQGFLIKNFGNLYDSQTINFIVLFSQAIASLALAFMTPFNFTSYSVASTLFLSIFAAVIAYSFYIDSIKVLRVSTVRLIGYIEPFLGSIWGVLILSQSLHQTTLIGGLIILGAAYLAVKSGE